VAHDAPTPLRRRVGTNLKYGLYLELGAPKVNLAPRPWLLVSLIENKPAINRLFSK